MTCITMRKGTIRRERRIWKGPEKTVLSTAHHQFIRQKTYEGLGKDEDVYSRPEVSPDLETGNVQAAV